jgi:hypothetical protein
MKIKMQTKASKKLASQKLTKKLNTFTTLILAYNTMVATYEFTKSYFKKK